MSKDNDDVEVTRDTTTSLPFGLGETMYTTDIKVGDDVHHGVGWSRSEADSKASDKVNDKSSGWW